MSDKLKIMQEHLTHDIRILVERAYNSAKEQMVAVLDEQMNKPSGSYILQGYTHDQLKEFQRFIKSFEM
jgi:hypothetical protein